MKKIMVAAAIATMTVAALVAQQRQGGPDPTAANPAMVSWGQCGAID